MDDRTLNIAVLGGFWSTNIGNAFFQLGTVWMLRRAVPGANVFLIGDPAAYWSVHKGSPANALDYVPHLEVDVLVLIGPFARREMRVIIGSIIEAHRRRGTRIIVISAGMMQYDDDTVRLTREMLEQAEPFLLTSRDRETYELFGDLAEHAYDGVDTATFVTDIFPAVPSDLPPYVVLNFDQIPEPLFRRTADAKPRPGDRVFEWAGEGEWLARQPKLRTELSYRSRAYLFAEALLPRRARPERLAGYDVLRTDHRYNPHLARKIYAGPRTYAGDIPHTYLSIYANSKCTFSNRVHACVATAAYGNPAMLFTRSPRAYLLKRLGLDTVKERPTRLDTDALRREKEALIRFVADTMALLEPGPVPAMSRG